jgi:rare lipoprotein A
VIRLRHIATFSAAITMAAILLLPAGAGASTGGVTATPNAPFLRVGSALFQKTRVNVSGRVADVATGARVDVQARRSGGAWKRVGSGTADKTGLFKTTWKTGKIGRYTLRAVPHSGASSSAVDPSAPPAGKAIVHYKAKASWFGPEDNGTQTACGVKLTKTVLGVANKSLPCGTQVSILFRGRRITVPVIDRGPYRKGYGWDLTIGTANKLKFTDTGLGTIGVVALTDLPLAKFARKR